MKIGIVGTRTPTTKQRQEVSDFVDSMPPSTVVVSGGARGIDTHAAMRARLNGLKVVEHMPDFTRYGSPRALFERNTLIVQDSDEVHAWPGPESKGTWHTVRKARAHKKPCTVYEEEKTHDDPG